jgi:MoaA/NifB/PqqE/SkfB family radical SAM enzyme
MPSLSSDTNFLSVHITDKCNSHCQFCVVSASKSRNHSSYKEIYEFLAANSGQGYSAVNFHGGEPTVHPRFLELLRAVHRLEYDEVHVQTNGMTLAKQDWTLRLVEAGVTLFIVSLHTAEADLHDRLTGVPGGFTRTCAGIANVVAAGTRVRTNTVLMRPTLSGLNSVIEMAGGLGVSHVNLSNLNPVGRASEHRVGLVPQVDEIRRQLLTAVAAAQELGLKVTLEGFSLCLIPEYLPLALDYMGRTIRMLIRGMVIEDYEAFMKQSCKILGPPCSRCTVQGLCGGAYPEFVEVNRWDRLVPFLTPPIVAPL